MEVNKTSQLRLERRGDINKMNTTLTVKLGTKHRLQEIMSKGETYDDAISRLISFYEQSSDKIDMYKTILDKHNISHEYNIIEAGTLERGISGIRLSDKATIEFSYNKPSGYNENYTMDIEIEEIIADKPGKNETKKLLEDPKESTLIQLWMVARVINRHFDPSYQVPSLRKKNLIDPAYWEKVKERTGLPETSYRNDILGPIKKYEEQLHE